MLKAIVSILFVLFSLQANANQIAKLKSFSIVNLQNGVDNLIFRFDKIKHYRFIRLSDDYFYIAIPNTIIAIETPLLPKGSVEKILVRIIKGETRIFFKLKKNFKYKFRLLLSSNRFLIVRIEKSVAVKPQKKQTYKPPESKKKTVIVIDPGHGGKDPGAVGKYNKEKTVTLSIGKYVAYFLKKDGYKVVMTRTKDTYPTLAQRVELANKVHATLFVSIHANYAPKDKLKAKGLEVYFVNTTSDKRALWLAAKENGMSISQISDLNRIILSLIQTSKIQYSKILAADVYKEMLKYGRKVYRSYKGRGVRQAPFYVLVGTHCPSILIETAFINNPSDALYLRNPTFRKALAKGIAKGIENFLKSKS